MNNNTNENKVNTQTKEIDTFFEEELRRGFKGVWIPKEIWEDELLNSSSKFVLAEIDNLDNDDGCFASNDYFAKFFNLSKSRCSEIISVLEKNKYITIEYKRDYKFEKVTRRVIRCVKKYRGLKRREIDFNVLTHPNVRGFKGVWIPKTIWLNNLLSLLEKCFYVEIDSFDNEYGCYQSNDYFAKFFKLSKRRCGQIIASLQEKNFVEISYKYFKNTKEIDRRIVKCLVPFEGSYKKKTEDEKEFKNTENEVGRKPNPVGKIDENSEVNIKQSQNSSDIEMGCEISGRGWEENRTPWEISGRGWEEKTKDNKTVNNKNLIKNISKTLSYAHAREEEFLDEENLVKKDNNSRESVIHEDNENVVLESKKDEKDREYEFEREFIESCLTRSQEIDINSIKNKEQRKEWLKDHGYNEFREKQLKLIKYIESVGQDEYELEKEFAKGSLIWVERTDLEKADYGKERRRLLKELGFDEWKEEYFARLEELEKQRELENASEEDHDSENEEYEFDFNFISEEDEKNEDIFEKEENATENTNSNQNEEGIRDLRQWFMENIWEFYPESRRRGLESTYNAFKRAIKNGSSIQEIKDGLDFYLGMAKSNRLPQEYIMLSNNFFMNEGWKHPHKNFKSSKYRV